MLYTSKLENVEWHQTDWDLSDYGPCNSCSIGIDEVGIPQCTDCRAFFSWRRDKNLITKYLMEQYEGDGWQEEYKKLGEIRSLVRHKRFDQLDLIHCTYRNKDGTIHTARYFYEKKR